MSLPLYDSPYISLHPSAVIPGCQPTSLPRTFLQLSNCRECTTGAPPVKTGIINSDVFHSNRFFPILSNGHTTATESAFLLVVVQNSTSLLPGSCWPYSDISPMIFTDSSFTGLEMRSKKALKWVSRRSEKTRIFGRILIKSWNFPLYLPREFKGLKMDIKTQAGSPWLNSFGCQFRIRNGSPCSVLQASIFGVNNSDISAKCHAFCHPKLSVSGSVGGFFSAIYIVHFNNLEPTITNSRSSPCIRWTWLGAPCNFRPVGQFLHVLTGCL